jgi:cell division protein FtsB
MLIELTSVNAFPDQSVFSFDSNLNDANYIPETGRLVWRKRKRLSNDKYFCGFEFNDLPEVLASRLNKKVSDGVQNLVKIWKINRVISILLTVMTIALIGYAVWLGGIIFQDVSRSNEGLLASATQQADLTREYQRLYADTTRRLADVTLELNQTTAFYQEAKNQLQSTQHELSMVKSVLSETEGLLAQAQARTIPQAAQVALTPDMVHNVQDGRALIASYRDRIHEVAALINQLKYENRLARISALAERDRVRLMYGNQGYFVKSGQPVQVDEGQYQAASFDALPPGKVPNPDSKVRVNVTVFQ